MAVLVNTLKRISKVISYFPMQRKHFDKLWLKIRPLCPRIGRERTYSSTLFAVISFRAMQVYSYLMNWKKNRRPPFLLSEEWLRPPPPPPTFLANTARMASSSLSYFQAFRSQIHDRTILLRFLGIILRVLRIEVSVWISQTIGKGVWFSIRFFSFLLYSVQWLNYRNCKRLREF